eukprot:COSAG01_NODE_63_length_29632_cov_270.650662_42_plen_88_part_00
MHAEPLFVTHFDLLTQLLPHAMLRSYFQICPPDHHQNHLAANSDLIRRFVSSSCFDFHTAVLVVRMIAFCRLSQSRLLAGENDLARI